MTLRRLKAIIAWCALACLLAGPGCTFLRKDSETIAPAKSLPSTTPWDLMALSRPPEYEWADQSTTMNQA